MHHHIYLFSVFFVTSLRVGYSLTKGNYRFIIDTKQYCIEDLKTPDGFPAPCKRSTARETMGLILPGMKDGILSTKEHVISTVAGVASVKSHPSYPYQYIMTTSKASYVSVDLLYNHRSINIASATHTDFSVDDFSGVTNLIEAGWTRQGHTVQDGATLNVWRRASFNGIHPDTGMNMSTLYVSGMAPDMWTLYMDEKDETPVRLVATNEQHGGIIYEEMEFSNVERLPDSFKLDDAISELYSVYQVDEFYTSADDAAMATGLHDAHLARGFLSGDIPMATSLPEDGRPSDWVSHRRLQEKSGIPYFTIEAGSVEETFFNAASGRRLMMFSKSFEFPHACKESFDVEPVDPDSGDAPPPLGPGESINGGKGTRINRYCLYVAININGFKNAYSVTIGVKLPDITDAKRYAFFRLTVSVSFNSNNEMDLDITLAAGGCVILFEVGIGAMGAGINVCLTGSITGHNLYDAKSRSLSASIGMSVSFYVSIRYVGSIFDVTLTGAIGCKAAPDGSMSAFGRIGVSTELVIVGASIFLDLESKNLDFIPNRWHFSSGISFSAWVNMVIWKPRWNNRFVLWQVGPVTFGK